MKNATYFLLFVLLGIYGCKDKVENPVQESFLDHKNIMIPGKQIPDQDKKESKTKSNTMTRDQQLIGTWRHTEIISSGSGEFYASMATDDFIEFRADGSVATWVGTATAGNSDMTIASDGDTNAQVGSWNTNPEHTQIIFTDPHTKQEARTNYFMENAHLMFSNGHSRKVYERIH